MAGGKRHQGIGEKQGYLQKVMLKSKSQDSRTDGKVPSGFRGALGGFLFSCRVELGMNVFSEWRVGWRAVNVSISNSPKNRGETGIFAEGDEEIKGTEQKK